MLQYINMYRNDKGMIPNKLYLSNIRCFQEAQKVLTPMHNVISFLTKSILSFFVAFMIFANMFFFSG